MGRPNRFQIMELYYQDIVKALVDLNKKILSSVDLKTTLYLNLKEWRLPESTSIYDFLEFLINKKKTLKQLEIYHSRELYVFTNTEVTAVEVALALNPILYLSHYSAVSFHDLTDEVIKSVYVNKEQSNKSISGTAKTEMTQKSIDESFSKPMRQTSSFVEYNEQRIYLLSGRYTNQLGVQKKGSIRVTNLERTLIDIAVRPDYAGGVYEVLSVYERAKGEASSNKIKAYLEKLNYIYPYHQAIGFYMERAGYNASALKLMESIPMEHDFYLTYNISDKDYSEKWRLYYPKHI